MLCNSVKWSKLCFVIAVPMKRVVSFLSSITALIQSVATEPSVINSGSWMPFPVDPMLLKTTHLPGNNSASKV